MKAEKLTKERQFQVAILLAVGSGTPRSHIIKLCEENLIIKNEDYKRSLKSGQSAGPKRLNWAINFLEKSDPCLIERTHGYATYRITQAGKDELKNFAREIVWYANLYGDPPHLTKKAVQSLSALFEDDPVEEDAAKLRNFLQSHDY